VVVEQKSAEDPGEDPAENPVRVQDLKDAGRFRVAMSDRNAINMEWSLGTNL
jgi:hypothetical protein